MYMCIHTHTHRSTGPLRSQAVGHSRTDVDQPLTISLLFRIVYFPQNLNESTCALHLIRTENVVQKSRHTTRNMIVWLFFFNIFALNVASILSFSARSISSCEWNAIQKEGNPHKLKKKMNRKSVHVCKRKVGVHRCPTAPACISHWSEWVMRIIQAATKMQTDERPINNNKKCY